MSGFWIAVIVLIVFAFVLSVVKMALKHEENIQRIKRGYPLADGSSRSDFPDDDEKTLNQKERLQ